LEVDVEVLERREPGAFDDVVFRLAWRDAPLVEEGAARGATGAPGGTLPVVVPVVWVNHAPEFEE
jgi:hypothetical protein